MSSRERTLGMGPGQVREALFITGGSCLPPAPTKESPGPTLLLEALVAEPGPVSAQVNVAGGQLPFQTAHDRPVESKAGCRVREASWAPRGRSWLIRPVASHRLTCPPGQSHGGGEVVRSIYGPVH